jgi:protein involved in polysaccharide export with SLBB domain
MQNRKLKFVRYVALFGLVISVLSSGIAVAQQNSLPRVPNSAALGAAPPGQAAPPTVGVVPGQPTQALPLPTGQPVAAPAGIDYVLGVGDKLQITVFGEDDLSGEFQVSSTGTLSMPLVGEIPAAGQTAATVQHEIEAKLGNGYMKDPHVSLQVSTYRPFFIVGEVMKPGSYTYVNGMTVINAVALAGGYTYRADKDDIKVKHGGVQGQEQHGEETTAVQPGDVVTIPERFF